MLPLSNAVSGNSWFIDLLISLVGLAGMGCITYAMRWLRGKAVDTEPGAPEKMEVLPAASLVVPNAVATITKAPASAAYEEDLLSVD